MYKYIFDGTAEQCDCQLYNKGVKVTTDIPGRQQAIMYPSLPLEIFREIFSYFVHDKKEVLSLDLLSCSLVSISWKSAVSSLVNPSTFQHLLFQREWPRVKYSTSDISRLTQLLQTSLDLGLDYCANIQTLTILTSHLDNPSLSGAFHTLSTFLASTSRLRGLLLDIMLPYYSGFLIADACDCLASLILTHVSTLEVLILHSSPYTQNLFTVLPLCHRLRAVRLCFWNHQQLSFLESWPSLESLAVQLVYNVESGNLNELLCTVARSCPHLRRLGIEINWCMHSLAEEDASARDGLAILAKMCHRLTHVALRIPNHDISRAPFLVGATELRRLSFYGCPRFSGQGITAADITWPNLRSINLTDCSAVTPRFVEAVVAACPRLRVVEGARGVAAGFMEEHGFVCVNQIAWRREVGATGDENENEDEDEDCDLVGHMSGLATLEAWKESKTINYISHD